MTPRTASSVAQARWRSPLIWLARAITLPAKLLFGFDAFVSYAREDGSAYAETLSNSLGAVASVRIDMQETRPNATLPLSLRFAIAFSKVLVIIVTPKAASSRHVAEEVIVFERWSRGPILPIELGQPVEGSAWWPHIAGVARTKEIDSSERKDLEPSAGIVARIRNSIGFWNLSRRQRFASSCFALVLLVLGLLVYRANAQRRESIEAASTAAGAASAARAEALLQQEAASSAAREAKEQSERAERSRQVAARLTIESYRAKAATARAVKDLSDAEQLRDSAIVQHLAAESSSRKAMPALSALLAIESLKRAATLRSRLPSLPADMRGSAFATLQEVAPLLRQRLGHFDFHNAGVLGVSFHGNEPIGATVAAGLSIVNLRSRQLMAEPMPGRVSDSVAFAPQGLVAVARNEVWISRIGDHSQPTSLGPAAGYVDYLEFSQDGTHLLVSSIVPEGFSHRTELNVWKLLDSSQRHEKLPVRPATERIRAAAINRDGSAVIIATDREVRIVDTRTRQVTQTIAVSSVPVRVAFSPDGRRVGIAGEDQIVRIRSVSGATDAERVSEVTFRSLARVRSLKFSPDNRLVFIGSEEPGAETGIAQVWEVRSGTETARLAVDGPVIDGVFNEAGSQLLVGNRRGSADLWSLQVPYVRAGLSGTLEGLAFSADGKRVAASTSREVQAWSTVDATRLESASFSGRISAVGFNVRGKLLAESEGAIYEVEGGSSRKIADLDPDCRVSQATRFDAAGRFIACGYQNPIVYDIDKAEIRLRTAAIGHLTGVAFDRNGDNVLIAGTSATEVWSLRTNRLLASLPGANFVALSPDGGTASLGRGSGVAELWSVKDALQVATLDHILPVLTMAFSNDGAQLIAGSMDSNIRIWDLKSRKELQIFRYLGRGQLKLVLSPDGRLLGIGNGPELQVAPWNVTELIRAACGQLQGQDALSPLQRALHKGASPTPASSVCSS
nr:toll/interleukin-1 receptor domain-containing protein [Aquabacterium terrae]